LFLSEGIFALKFLDLLFGLILIFLGIVLYSFLSWQKGLSVYFGKMSFMQWLSSGGTSGFFSFMGLYKFETG